MSDIFLYADETGNLDYNVGPGMGASKFFGIGTAMFDRDHSDELWRGMRLRAEISGHGEGHVGISLPRGFHAVQDKRDVRHRVYAEIQSQAPRFDVTFMKKANAYSYVKQRGGLWLYKYAFFQHLMRVAPLVATPADTLYVIVASLGTAARQGDVPGGGVVSRLGCHVVDVVSHRAMVSENCLGISRKDTYARWLLTSLPSSSCSGN